MIKKIQNVQQSLRGSGLFAGLLGTLLFVLSIITVLSTPSNENEIRGILFVVFSATSLGLACGLLLAERRLREIFDEDTQEKETNTKETPS
jgi:hypothetical protein